jgi:hypothetical protein
VPSFEHDYTVRGREALRDIARDDNVDVPVRGRGSRWSLQFGNSVFHSAVTGHSIKDLLDPGPSYIAYPKYLAVQAWWYAIAVYVDRKERGVRDLRSDPKPRFSAAKQARVQANSSSRRRAARKHNGRVRDRDASGLSRLSEANSFTGQLPPPAASEGALPSIL